MHGAARPAVVGEVAAVPELAYVSQLALDAPSNLIIAASQKGDSVAIRRRGGRREPQIRVADLGRARRRDGRRLRRGPAPRVRRERVRRHAQRRERDGPGDARHRRGRMRAVWKSTTESRPRHRTDVASMAWGVATISAQVAHDARGARPSRSTRRGGASSSRRGRARAWWRPTCATRPRRRSWRRSARRGRPRTPSRSWRWLRGPCSSFCSRFGSRRRRVLAKAVRAARVRPGRQGDEAATTWASSSGA